MIYSSSDADGALKMIGGTLVTKSVSGYLQIKSQPVLNIRKFYLPLLTKTLKLL